MNLIYRLKFVVVLSYILVLRLWYDVRQI